MPENDSFDRLLSLVVAACDEIGSYIQNTEFITTRYSGSALHGYNSSRPLEYLQTWSWTRSWNEYFDHVMEEWDEDRLSGMRFNALIERLSAPAARLDRLLPELEMKCARLPNVPLEVTQHAREMQTSVNSFLNSADSGLNYWRKQEGTLTEGDIRQRRPVVNQDVQEKHESDQETDKPLIRPKASSTLSDRLMDTCTHTLLSNSALLAWTGIISALSCGFSFYAYSLRVRTPGRLTGRLTDADFYNALQGFLLQNIALYSVLVPALRSKSVRERYPFWTWYLSFLSFAAGCVGVGVYTRNVALSPLLNCVSSILQIFVTLQLVFFTGGGKDIAKEEHEA